MNAAWTPGPWRYEPSSCSHGGYRTCREGCRIAGIWAPPTVNHMPTLVAEPMWIRDITLIAAAPELAEYVRQRAVEGDPVAVALWERANGEVTPR